MKKHPLLLLLLLAARLSFAQHAVTKEEAIAIAHQLEDATNAHNAVLFDRFLDIDSLLARIRDKSHALKDPGFDAGFSPSFKQNFPGLGKQVIAGIKMGKGKGFHQGFRCLYLSVGRRPEPDGGQPNRCHGCIDRRQRTNDGRDREYAQTDRRKQYEELFRREEGA